MSTLFIPTAAVQSGRILAAELGVGVPIVFERQFSNMRSTLGDYHLDLAAFNETGQKILGVELVISSRSASGFTVTPSLYCAFITWVAVPYSSLADLQAVTAKRESEGYKALNIPEAGADVMLAWEFDSADDYVVTQPYAEDTDGQRVEIQEIVQYTNKVWIRPEMDAAFVQFTVTRKAQ